jgi:transcriptional regulator with XRE-family HTH domain
MTGNEFRKCRELSGLTIKQCADYLGLSTATIWRYEHNDLVPKCVELSIGALNPSSPTLEDWILRCPEQEKNDIKRRQARAALAEIALAKMEGDKYASDLD